MPIQSDIIALFDFENILADAIAAALTAQGLVVVTPNSITQLQKERPRCDCVVRVGAGRQILLPTSPPTYELAWTGEINLSIITDSAEDAKLAHAAYRSMLRYLAPRLPSLVNGITLLNHNIKSPVRDEGTSLVMANEEGHWASTLQFGIDFTIQPDALTTLLAS
jgi:hypothetical protein